MTNHAGTGPTKGPPDSRPAATSPLAPSLPPANETSPDRITLVGLVLETAAGLRRNLAPSLDCQLGVGGQAFEIVLRLSRTPGGNLRMIDLAGQTGLTPSGLSRAIDRLVEAGLVERQACAEDRRGAFASLTPLGWEKTGEAVRAHRRDIDSLLGGTLRPSQEERLVELLRVLRNRVHPDALLGAEGEPTR